jgi:TPR repeat protein
MPTVIDWNKYKNASLDEKIQMLQEGAENGDALCQFGYGYHLEKTDHDTAMHWFEESDKQGFLLASHALGFYSTGFKASSHLYTSAECGCTASWLTLGCCYENCDEVRDRFLAYQCYLNTVQWEYHDDMFKKMLGPIYSDELWDALALNRASCIATAQYLLGWLYIDASHVINDTKTGIEWLTKASENGNWKATYTLGYFYANGSYNIKQNPEKAKRLLESLKNNVSKSEQEKLRFALSLCNR